MGTPTIHANIIYAFPPPAPVLCRQEKQLPDGTSPILDWQKAAADPAIIPQQVKPSKHNINGIPIQIANGAINPPASAIPTTIEQFFIWNQILKEKKIP